LARNGVLTARGCTDQGTLAGIDGAGLAGPGQPLSRSRDLDPRYWPATLVSCCGLVVVLSLAQPARVCHRRPVDQPVNLSPMTDKLFLLTEAAEVTGTTVEAIRQRIKRRKLHAVKGNDGLLRVRLTPADIEAIATGRGWRRGQSLRSARTDVARTAGPAAHRSRG
jgi:hypothetical protein